MLLRSLLFAGLVVGMFCVNVRAQVCGNPGKDGPGGTLGGIINSYYPGSGTANAGTTTVTVGASNSSGALTAIAVGDLLLVIQMQDASINSNNSSSYGDGVSGGLGSGATSYNNAGRYEYVVATSAIALSGGSITIRATGTGNGLKNSYATAAATSSKGQATFQVVRVPQYSSATLSSSLTAAAWDGSSGGILVLDVAGNLSLGGTVSVDALGFRGGGAQQLGGGSGSSTDYRTLATNAANASKGEGNAGTPRYLFDGSSVIDNLVEGYPNGSFGRGAPGNAGGGGTDGNPSANDQNSGGGGGGNGGAGGLGGNSWSSNLAIGGAGGAAFSVAAVDRLVLGGGGGAASRNNSSGTASSGARGGGMVLVRAGTITGSGTISANGAAGSVADNDGGGGGGAGGSILVVANSGGLGSLTVRATGGRGGDAWPTQAPNGSPGERHGPGGGGGGGFVAVSASATTVLTGGVNGTTTTAADAYGSTAGAAGSSITVTASSVPGASGGAQCVPALTIVKTTSTPTVVNTPTGVAATYKISATNAASVSDAQTVALSDALPAGFTYTSTTSVTLTGGATRPTTSDPAVGATNPSFGIFNIPAGGKVQIIFTVTIAASVGTATYQNPATATYLDPKRTVPTGTTTAVYDPASSPGEDVAVTAAPSVALVKTVSPGGTQSPGTDLTFQISFSNGGGVVARNLVIIDPRPANTDFKVSSVTNSLGTTGLTVVVAYSNNGGTTYAYTPVSGGGSAPAGYDRNVTNIRWTFTGNLSQTSPNNAGSVSFLVRIR